MTHTDAPSNNARKGLHLERKISVGDLLTTCSILITLGSLLVSGALDRDLRRKEQAGKIRAAAAQTLVKLDRWQEVSLSVFDAMDTSYVETKEKLRTKYDIIGARHFLWESHLIAEASARQRALDDHLELGYVDLYSYDPSVKDKFASFLRSLKQKERDTFDDLRIATQGIVGHLETNKITHENFNLNPDELYNDLHVATSERKKDYSDDIDKTVAPMREALAKLITESDATLLDSPHLQYEPAR